MPKKLRVELSDIAQWNNVSNAAYKAAKGKRQRSSVKTFFADFDNSILRVQQAILSGSLLSGNYKSFVITDPKPRIIHAASFEDRVIHHALINKIGSRLDSSWVDTSFACRQSKGSHKAILLAAKYAEKSAFIAKLDVRSYFANIQHDVLLQLLKRQLKNTDMFLLIEAVLRSFGSKGLPIGALTSQYFANHYLDGFQRWLRTQNILNNEVRYMDDVLLFCDSKQQAKQLVEASVTWLQTYRQLPLKPALIQKSHIGVTFCGCRVSSRGIALGERRKRNINNRLKSLLWSAKKGVIDTENAMQEVNTIRALSTPATHCAWLKNQMVRIPDAWELEI